MPGLAKNKNMSYIKGKNKVQILEEMYNTAQPGSPVHEQQKMGIIVRCIEDLEMGLKSLKDSMNENAKSNDKLAKKIFFLNIILTSATIIGTVIAVINLLCQIK